MLHIFLLRYDALLSSSLSAPSDNVEHRCPVNLTSEHYLDSHRMYSDCVTVHFWMKADGMQSDHSRHVYIHYPTLRNLSRWVKMVSFCSLADLRKSQSVQILSPVKEEIKLSKWKRNKVAQVFAFIPAPNCEQNNESWD